MTEFTPWMSLAGGAMIGLAAVLLMATDGKIAGVSGVANRLLPPEATLDLSSIVFLIGLITALPVYVLVTGQSPTISITPNIPVLVVAGLVVGFGTTLGNGCTSGHGVCGISRLSGRSFAATIIFMASAFVTVLVSRHLLGG